VIFQSYGLTQHGPEKIIEAYQQIAGWADRFIAFAAGLVLEQPPVDKPRADPGVVRGSVDRPSTRNLEENPGPEHIEGVGAPMHGFPQGAILRV